MRTLRYMLISMLVLSGVVLRADDNEEWLNKHAVTITTATTQIDANNVIKSRQTVKDTTIAIHQTVTEVEKPDTKGHMQLVSRVTTSTDSAGGSTVIVDTLIAASPTLITTSITVTEKTVEGLVTTVRARDKTGRLVVAGRTVVASITN